MVTRQKTVKTVPAVVCARGGIILPFAIALKQNGETEVPRGANGRQLNGRTARNDERRYTEIPTVTNVTAETEYQRGDSVSVSAAAEQTSSCSVALPTALVRLQKDNNSVTVRALLDIGSQRTFILKNIVDNLKLEPVYQSKTLN